MKSLACTYTVIFLLIFLWTANLEAAPPQTYSEHTGHENIRDSLSLNLQDTLLSICIDSSVWLLCPSSIPDEKVLSYEWVDLRTHRIYSTRDIRVAPDTTTDYQLTVVYIDPERNLIQNGDFEKGNRYFATEYKLTQRKDSNALWDEGTYIIAKNAKQYHSNFLKLPDHTSGSGNMMVVNGDTKPNVMVWGQNVQNIMQGSQYAFSAWVATVSEGALPRMRFAINSKPLGNIFAATYKKGWQLFYYLWTAEANQAAISIVDSVTDANGNDFVLDDISFAPVHKAVGKIRVSVLPRLVLDDMETVCESEGFPAVVGSGITEYEWKKQGTSWSSREQYPDASNVEGGLPGFYTCRVKGVCGETQDTFRIVKQLKITEWKDKVTVCKWSWRASLNLSVKAEGENLSYQWRYKETNGSFGKLLSADSACTLIGYRNELGTYVCMVDSHCGQDTLEVEVSKGTTEWLRVPTDTVVCKGNEVEWIAETSLAQSEIEWILPDGRTIIGDTLRVSEEGTYTYRTTDCEGKLQQGKVHLGVHPYPGHLDLGKEKDTVCRGDVFRLASNCQDTSLRYEWRHKGQLTGTDTVFSLSSVSDADSGWHVLEMTDVCNISQYDSVYLSLRAPLLLPFRDSVFRVCEGVDTGFTTIASGEGLEYHWLRGTGNGARLELPSVSLSDSGVYRCELKDLCGNRDTLNLSLKVLQAPHVISITPSVLLKEGSEHILKAECTGDSLEYAWTKNGAVFAADTSCLYFPSLSYADSGLYRLEVTNGCGVAADTSLIRTYWETGFTTDSFSVALCRGVDTVLSAYPLDTTGLCYHWYYEGTGLPEGSGRYVLSDADKALEGNYECEIRGRGWSKRVFYKVSVWDSLQAELFPPVLSLCVSDEGEFRVRATGKDVTYVWQDKGTGWQTVEDSIYRKSGVGESDSGLYVCQVSSFCGSKELQGYLEVEEALVYTKLLADRVVCQGESVRWAVVSDRGRFKVRWWYPGEGITGPGIVTDSVLSLTVVDARMAGWYRYRLEGICDTSAIFSVHLGVHPYPGHLDLGKEKDTACRGAIFRLASNCQDTNLRYEWRHKGRLTGTDTVFSLSSVSDADSGWHVLEMTDVCNISQYDSVYLSLRAPLLLPFRDSVFRVCEGVDTGFTTIASGEGLEYHWLRGTGNGARLELPSVSLSDSGVYRCELKDLCGNRDTLSLFLKVLQAPYVTSITPSVLLKEGSEHVLKAECTGDSLEYAWTKNGAMFAADTSCLYFPSLSYADSGLYRLEVTNGCGVAADTSSIRTYWETGFTTDSFSVALCRGVDTVLSAYPLDTTGLCYHWYYEGTGLPEGSGRYVLSDADKVLEGNYECEIRGRGWSKRVFYKVSVWDSLQAELFPPVLSLCVSDEGEFRVRATGKDVTYVWQDKGRGWQTVEDSIYRKSGVGESDSGLYVCQVSSFCGSKELQGYLEVEEALVYTKLLADRVVCQGESVRWAVVSDRGRFKVRWWYPGEEITGPGIVTDSVLSLTVVDAGMAGWYRYRLEGICDTTTVFSVHLGVHPYPGHLDLGKEKDTVCRGDVFRLVSNCQDTSLRYEWRHKGQLTGTDTVFSLSSVSDADSGWYVLEMTDVCNISQYDSVYLSLHAPLLLPFRDSVFCVCEGVDTGFTTIASGEGLEYRWLRGTGNGARLELPSVSLSDSGVYRCEVKDLCGNRDTLNLFLKVLQAPHVISISEGLELMEGEYFRMEALVTGDSVIYKWTKEGNPVYSNGPWVEKDTVQEQDKGRYKLEVQNRCGRDSAFCTVDVWKTVFWETGSENEEWNICEGADTLLKANALNVREYAWYHADGHLLQKSKSPVCRLENVSIADSGLYWCVAVGEGTHNTDTAYVYLRVNEGLRIVGFDSLMRRCKGDKAEWQVNARGTRIRYTWEGGGAGWYVKSNQTYCNEQLQPEDAGKYRCSVNSSCGDTVLQAALVIRPSLEVKANAGEWTFCPGEVMNLSVEATGDSLTYCWTKNGLEEENREKHYEVNHLSLADTGLYKCRLRSACGDSLLKWQVNVDMVPDLELHIPSEVGACLDSLKIDSVFPAGGIVKVNGEEANRIQFLPGVEKYTVCYIYTTNRGCRDSVVREVVKASPPSIRINGDSITGYCRNATSQIEEMSEGTVEWQGEGWVQAGLRKWVYKPSGSEKEVTYKVVLTDSYGCFAVDSGKVRICPLPEISLSADSLVGECNDLVVSMNYRGEGILHLDWYPSKGLEIRDDTTVFVKQKQNGLNKWFVQVTDRFNCQGTDSVIVNVVAAPSSEVKESCASMPEKVDVRIYRSYQWDDGYTDSIRLLEEAGSYLLEVTDAFGCTGEKEFVVHPLPVFALRDTFIFEDENIRLEPEGLEEWYGPYAFRWWNGEGGRRSPVVEAKGFYSVTITDNIGCEASDTAYLTVKKRGIEAPDAFLPDSKGENSRFYLKELNFIDRFEMYIYNRWGELVYYTREIGFAGGWDGVFKGTECNPGAYLWVAKNNGKIIGKGTVMLVK